jgi:hypothetical protein
VAALIPWSVGPGGRALKRRLSDLVYRAMFNDAIEPAEAAAAGATVAERTGPRRHSGTTTNSSAVGSNPGIEWPAATSRRVSVLRGEAQMVLGGLVVGLEDVVEFCGGEPEEWLDCLDRNV